MAKTDGVPLFVEELTKTVLESGLLDGRRRPLRAGRPAAAARDPVDPARLADGPPRPPRAGQGDRADRRRDRPRVLATSCSPRSRRSPEADLSAALDQLVAAELIFRRGTPPEATYRFKHALVQDAAYQSLLKRTRQQLHARIAELLESKFPEVVETQPELLARHYTEAGSAGKAVTYWQRAGERRCNDRPIWRRPLTSPRGWRCLRACRRPERARRELDLLTAMGPALTATKGYAAPEVETAYRRALELCQELGDTPRAVFGAARSLALSLPSS